MKFEEWKELPDVKRFCKINSIFPEVLWMFSDERQMNNLKNLFKRGE